MVLEPGLSRPTRSAYSHKNRNTAQEEIENRKKSKVKREPAEEIDLLDWAYKLLFERINEYIILDLPFSMWTSQRMYTECACF
jgi:hypothetical protein